MPLSVVGDSMTWGEALRLTKLLMADPGSQIAASVLEWDYPVSREDLVARDLYDITQAMALAGSKKKPRPYPRPWPDKSKRRLGNARMSVDQLRRVLDQHRGATARRDQNGRLHDARGRFVAG